MRNSYNSGQLSAVNCRKAILFLDISARLLFVHGAYLLLDSLNVVNRKTGHEIYQNDAEEDEDEEYKSACPR